MFDTVLRLRAGVRAYLACDPGERATNKEAMRSRNTAMRFFPLAVKVADRRGAVLRPCRDDALSGLNAQSTEDVCGQKSAKGCFLIGRSRRRGGGACPRYAATGLRPEPIASVTAALAEFSGRISYQRPLAMTRPHRHHSASSTTPGAAIVIASASEAIQKSHDGNGLLRRFAPRNDGGFARAFPSTIESGTGVEARRVRDVAANIRRDSGRICRPFFRPGECPRCARRAPPP